MIEKVMPCLGTFEVENKLWPFYADDYCFSIMSPTPTYDFFETSIIKPEDGFLYGKTYYKNNVAVHLSEEIQTVDCLRLKTDSFIYSSAHIDVEQFKHFNRILFVGGVLNKLSFNSNDSLKEDAPPINNKFKFNVSVINLKKEKFEMLVKIYSAKGGSYGFGSHKTVRIDNYLELIFENKQPLNSVFYHYEKIKKIIAFLTGYKNVYFDRVDIYHSPDELWGSQFYNEENKTIDDLYYTNSITFDCLGENSIKDLFALVYGSKPKEGLPSLDFLPLCSESYTMNVNYIRSICSAIEYELNLVDISSDEKKKIKTIITEIKKIIDESKASSSPLKDKTYSIIESSMSHWDMSLADKIEELRNKMKWEFNFIQDRLEDRNDISITDFIKCRNSITHKANDEISKTVANTGLVLRSIIRCCILKRINVPQETILELCKTNKV